MRLARDHVSSGEAQLLDNLEAPGFKGSSIGIADVVASSAADGSVNLLAYAAFSEPGSGELQLGHFQSDGSLVLKPLSDRASSLIDDGALLSSVQPLSSGGFLLLDGSNGQADRLVRIEPDGAIDSDFYVLNSTVSSLEGLSGLGMTSYGDGVAFLAVSYTHLRAHETN